MPARRRDTRQLVEERDHVVHRHQLERAVGERQRGRVGDVVALAVGGRGVARLGDHSLRDVGAVTCAPGQRAATSRATAPLPGAEVEDGRGRRGTASSAARIASSRVGDARVASHSGASRSKFRVSGPRKTLQSRGHRTTVRHEPREPLAGRHARAIRISSPADTPVSRAASPRLIASVMKP